MINMNNYRTGRRHRFTTLIVHIASIAHLVHIARRPARRHDEGEPTAEPVGAEHQPLDRAAAEHVRAEHVLRGHQPQGAARLCEYKYIDKS